MSLLVEGLSNKKSSKSSVKRGFNGIELLVVDCKLLKNEYSSINVKRIVSELPKNIHTLLLASSEREQALGLEIQKYLPRDRSTLYQRSKGEFQANIILDFFARTLKDRDVRPSDLSTKIQDGKQILYLAFRSSRFINRFKKPEGVRCHNFYRIIWGTECTFDCSYCYLQLTYRISPYVRQYLNWNKMDAEIRRLDESTNKTIVLNSGELSDSLCVDDITETVSYVVAQIEKTRSLNLLLLTKSANVEHIPQTDTDKIIYSVSLTIPENQIRFEKGTATIEERISALRKAERKGYRIRVRLDPIFIQNGENLEQYFALIDKILQLTPETVTLGQPRFYPPLLHIIKRRNPSDFEFYNKLVYESSLEGRRRASDSERISIYLKLSKYIREQMSEVFPALCKEESLVWHQLKRLTSGRCNCI